MVRVPDRGQLPVILQVLTMAGAATLLHLGGVPAGALIGALVVASVFSVRGQLRMSAPPRLRSVALGALGWMVGSRVGEDTLAALARGARPIALGVAIIVVGSWLLAYALYRLTDLDASTAVLALAPGGIAEMASLARSSGASLHLVAAAHLIRMAVVLTITPILAVAVFGGG